MTKPLIDLTRGVPPIDVFPVDDLIECGEAALRRDAAVLLQYSHAGYLPFREWLADQHGVGIDQILTGNSSLEVFAYISQVLLTPGQRAFVESPSYDRSITLLRHNKAAVVGLLLQKLLLQKDGVDLGALQAELEKGVPALMYVIADFQNPMGVTTSLEKREQLVALAEAYGFWIVEDAPYRRLRYRGEDVPSLWSLAPNQVLHTPGSRRVVLLQDSGPGAAARLRDWAAGHHRRACRVGGGFAHWPGVAHAGHGVRVLPTWAAGRQH